MAKRTQPCGTDAAYLWHRRHGEEPCQPCKDAHTENCRRDQAAKPARVPLPQGIPEPLGRWSTEQRVAALHRQKLMRFLQESVLLSSNDLRELCPEHNAYQDAQAAGWTGRPWCYGIAPDQGIGYRADFFRTAQFAGRYRDDIYELPKPPFQSLTKVAFWLYKNSCWSAAECAAAVGLHQSIFSRSTIHVMPRDRSRSVERVSAPSPSNAFGRRGDCSICGRNVALTAEGIVRQHRDTDRMDCAGSRTAPSRFWLDAWWEQVYRVSLTKLMLSAG